MTDLGAPPSPVDPIKVLERANKAEAENFPFVFMGITELRELCDLALRAEPAEHHQPCRAETPSWEHFRPEQVDSYWIRCSLAGPHEEHEDSNTGLTWKD